MSVHDATLFELRLAIRPMLQGYEATELDVERACYWFAYDNLATDGADNLKAAFQQSEYVPPLEEIGPAEGSICQMMYNVLQREFSEE